MIQPTARAILLLSTMLVVPACVETAGQQATTTGTPLLPIYNARVPAEGVLSGGQPTEEQVRAAARAGFRTVINLRAAKESGFDWEADLVDNLGMRYVHIPIGSVEALDRSTVERIDAALREGRAAGPVLFHCASGNRIGAVLALRTAWLEGTEPAKALDYGLATGLTSLEAKTRKLLGLSEKAAAAP